MGAMDPYTDEEVRAAVDEVIMPNIRKMLTGNYTQDIGYLLEHIRDHEIAYGRRSQNGTACSEPLSSSQSVSYSDPLASRY